VIPYLRKNRIMDELEKKEIVYLEHFVDILQDVSESTIRRDLKILASEGKIVLLHGGAIKLKKNSKEVPVISKKFMNVKQKEKIARYAASLIQNGETIYIDSGTTTELMFKYLKNKDITIVTTNIHIVNQLEDTKFECILIGGEIIKNLGSTVGPLTDRQLDEFHFNRSFIGANGYSDTNGISTYDLRETSKKRIVKKNSDNCYVLLDSTKIGLNAVCKVFEFDEVTVLSDKANDLFKGFNNFVVV
jgi:DeoR family fructose operon transcriptional repressor